MPQATVDSFTKLEGDLEKVVARLQQIDEELAASAEADAIMAGKHTWGDVSQIDPEDNERGDRRWKHDTNMPL